ncbi:MAG: hypothetical protein SF051_01035 [Elusimicrobiota bacterium]|nr:hypothetical protein [Elusimicrobiota bacterium]
MKCPGCAAAAPDGATECPSCGVIFAKLAARLEKERAQAKAHAALLDAPAPPAPPDPRRTRHLALAIVGAWVVVMATVVHLSMKRAKARAGTSSSDDGPPRAIQMRDPVTGDMKTLPIVDGAARPAREDD